MQREISTPAVVGAVTLAVVLIVAVGWFALFRKPAPLPMKSATSMQGMSMGGGRAGRGPVERKGDIN